MTVDMHCRRCPYLHPPGVPCPAGYHEVPTKGGDSERRRFWPAVRLVLIIAATLAFDATLLGLTLGWFR